jgi:hypothetical protein
MPARAWFALQVHVLGNVVQAVQAEAENDDRENGYQLEQLAPDKHHGHADEQSHREDTALRHILTSFLAELVLADIICAVIQLNNAPIGCQ